MFTQSYWKVELVLTDSTMMRVERTNERVDTVISIVLIFVPVAVAADFFMTADRRMRGERESASYVVRREWGKERREEQINWSPCCINHNHYDGYFNEEKEEKESMI